VAAVMVWVILRLALPPGQEPLIYLAYPLWGLNLARTYLAFASEAGGLYIQGGAFVALTLVFAVFLPWAPLLAAGLMFVNMTASGLLLRRGMGTRRDESPGG
jgi:hypothetical protein